MKYITCSSRLHGFRPWQCTFLHGVTCKFRQAWENNGNPGVFEFLTCIPKTEYYHKHSEEDSNY